MLRTFKILFFFFSPKSFIFILFVQNKSYMQFQAFEFLQNYYIYFSITIQTLSEHFGYFSVSVY